MGLPHNHCVGQKAGDVFVWHGTCHKIKNKPVPKYLYISMGGKVVYFYTPNLEELPIIYIYGVSLYKVIQGTEQAFANHSFEDRWCFILPLIIPLFPGDDTACLDLVFEYPFTTAAAYTITPWFGPMMQLWLLEWSFCNAPCRRCGGGFALLLQKLARQDPLGKTACLQSR